MIELRYPLHTIFVTLMLSWGATAVQAGGAVPVMIGGEADLDACGGFGEVRGLNPYGDGFLAVRTGPGTKYSMIDRLYNGDQVHFCDYHGNWIGIVYGKPGQDCGVGSILPRQQPYRGPCGSGCAHRNWLVLTAG